VEATNDPSAFSVEDALPVLEATPGVLRSLLENLPDAWVNFQEDPEAWSPRTVLVHFVHNETTNWIPRLRVVLSDNSDRRFPPFQQLPDAGELTVAKVAELLPRFARQRQESLSVLRSLNLGEDQLEREAQHPALGTVKLRHLLATWVVHDLNHLHQVAKSLSKRYQAAVGPWRKNLAILDL
jgi:hypothetical protein